MTVHHHAPRERIVSRHQPASERQTILRGIRRQRRQKRWHVWFHCFFRLKELAAMMAKGLAVESRRSFLHDERGRILWHFVAQLFHLSTGTGKIRGQFCELMEQNIT